MFGDFSPIAQATVEAKKLKKQVFAVSCMVLAFLLLSSADPSSASYPETINKAAYIYGITWDAAAISYAQHFDLVDVDFNGSRTDFYIDYYTPMAQLKATDPSITIIGYKDAVFMKTFYDDWATVAAHSDWFLKDASGNYLYNSAWGAYLMDPASTGWQQHYADYVNAKFAQGTGNVYDGVFADDVWNQVSAYSFNGTVQAADSAAWHADMEAFLTHIKTDISGIVLANSDEWHTDDYLEIVDGQMLEGYVHAAWDPPGTFDSTHLNLGGDLARKGASGKILWAASGTVISGDPTALLEKCYNDFVANSTDLAHNYFGFNDWSSSDGSKGYYALMDTPLEGPTPTPSPTPAAATPTPTPQYYIIPQAYDSAPTTNMGLANSGLVALVKLCMLIGFGSVVVFSFIKKEPFEVIMEIFFVGIVGVLAVWFFI